MTVKTNIGRVPIDQPAKWSIGQMATAACVLEATVPKPGNVHRGADFADLTFADFLLSAIAIGPAMQLARAKPLGETILDAIQATRNVVETNTNLGLVLLIAPLAKVDQPDKESLLDCIKATNKEDCRRVYQAIRLANPGGMGKVDRADVAGPAPDSLFDAMNMATQRDMIAWQYVHSFETIFDVGLPLLRDSLEQFGFTEAVIWTQLKLMQQFPDSLVARKSGPAVAELAAAKAGRVLESGKPGDAEYFRQLSDFDFWLRSDGHKRNPGTTADLIGAILFVCLRQGILKFPKHADCFQTRPDPE